MCRPKQARNYMYPLGVKQEEKRKGDSRAIFGRLSRVFFVSEIPQIYPKNLPISSSISLSL